MLAPHKFLKLDGGTRVAGSPTGGIVVSNGFAQVEIQPADRASVGSICLYSTPNGFTWEDAQDLREAIEWLDASDIVPADFIAKVGMIVVKMIRLLPPQDAPKDEVGVPA